MNYYNENDPKAAAWLRELVHAGLISEGVVDERSIADVQPADLTGYHQCHFFAGIGGWSYALRLAGVSDDEPVWTGSCPCQPFSHATRGRGGRLSSEKHLWPHMHRLLLACRPAHFFGEQVSTALDWLDVVWTQMEEADYSFWPLTIPSYVVGTDHKRERIYFASYPNNNGQPRRSFYAKAPGMPWVGSNPAELVLPDGFPSTMAYRGFGNAIVPQVAAQFICAYYDVRSTFLKEKH